MFHFYCRIRPPTQFEQLTANHAPSRSRSPNMSSPKPLKSPSNMSMHMYSIFACSEEKIPEIAICSENPIKGTLIEKTFGKEKDLEDYKASILEKARFFYYDHVFSWNTPQQQLYSDVLRENVSNLLRGVSSNVVLYGPNSAGKNFTLRGGENKEAGLLIQSVESLLSLIEVSKQTSRSPMKSSKKSQISSEQYRLYTSISGIYNEELYDLIAIKGKKILSGDNFEGLTVYPIRFLSEFKNFYRIAANNLKGLGNKRKDSESKGASHVFISICVKKVEVTNQELTREVTISKLTFVKLADSDNLEKQDDFREMSRFLQELPLKRNKTIGNDEENILVSVLRECVTAKSMNVFLCLVSGSPSIFGPCIQAMKYTQKTREALLLNKPEQSPRKTAQNKSPIYDSDLNSEIKRLYKEIFNFSNISKGFSYSDCINWLNDKDYKLFTLEKKVKKQENPSKDQINILSETKGFLQSLKTKMLEDSNNNNVKDFSGLISQYKRSLKNFETMQLNNQKPELEKPERNLNLEYEISSLKKNIMNKIDEAIVASPRKTAKENQMEVREIKSLLEEKETLEKMKSILENNGENKDPNIEDVDRYQKKLGNKKEIIADLKEEIKNNQIRFQDEKDRLLEEIGNLRSLLDQNKRMFEELSSDLDKRTQVPNEYLYKLEENQAFQNQLIQELRAQILEKTDENHKISKDFNEKLEETEKNLLLELRRVKEENSEIMRVSNEIKQKNKIIFEENKNFVYEIENLKEMNNKLLDERDHSEHVMGENSGEINFLKKELERTRGIKESLSELVESNNERIKSLENQTEEDRRRMDLLTEEKLNIERIEIKDQEIIKEMERNNLNLIDENRAQRDYIAKLEGQLNYLKNEQSRGFDELEQKVQDFLEDNEKLYQENQGLFERESVLKEALDQVFDDKKRIEEEYRDLFERYEEIRMNYEHMEEELKEFTNEKKEEVKGLGIKEVEEKTVDYDNGLLEKLKMLENLQTTIKVQMSSGKKMGRKRDEISP